jgi:hypothetical protein
MNKLPEFERVTFNQSEEISPEEVQESLDRAFDILFEDVERLMKKDEE